MKKTWLAPRLRYLKSNSKKLHHLIRQKKAFLSTVIIPIIKEISNKKRR